MLTMYSKIVKGQSRQMTAPSTTSSSLNNIDKELDGNAKNSRMCVPTFDIDI